MDDLDDEFAPPARDRSTSFTLAMTVGFFVVLLILWLLLKDKAEDQADADTPAVTQPQSTAPLQPDGTRPPPAIPIAEEETAPVDPPPAPVTVDGAPKAEFEILPNCRLVSDPGNDADTLLCRTEAGKMHRFVLYWADAPEIGAAAGPFMQKFSLTETSLESAAKEASDMSKRLLESVPFNIVTNWQKADGDAHFAYLYYADGRGQPQNLSLTLIRQGLAMIRPEERGLPDGTSPGQFLDELQRAQAEARESRRGAWGLALE